jgi:hypothetical protein
MERVLKYALRNIRQYKTPVVETGTLACEVSRNSLGIRESDIYVQCVYIFRDISKYFHVRREHHSTRTSLAYYICTISMRNSATCSPSDERFLVCLYDAFGCRSSDSIEYRR